MSDVLWRANDGEVVVWLMDGSGVRASMACGYAPRATWDLAGVGDFNKDRHADVVWRNRVDGSFALWVADLPNQLPGSGTIKGEDPLYWTVLGVADYDGDGSADILWQSKAGDVSIWFMSGTAVRTRGPAGSGWVSSIWTAQP